MSDRDLDLSKINTSGIDPLEFQEISNQKTDPDKNPRSGRVSVIMPEENKPVPIVELRKIKENVADDLVNKEEGDSQTNSDKEKKLKIQAKIEELDNKLAELKAAEAAAEGEDKAAESRIYKPEDLEKKLWSLLSDLCNVKDLPPLDVQSDPVNEHLLISAYLKLGEERRNFFKFRKEPIEGKLVLVIGNNDQGDGLELREHQAFDKEGKDNAVLWNKIEPRLGDFGRRLKSFIETEDGQKIKSLIIKAGQLETIYERNETGQEKIADSTLKSIYMRQRSELEKEIEELRQKDDSGVENLKKGSKEKEISDKERVRKIIFGIHGMTPRDFRDLIENKKGKEIRDPKNWEGLKIVLRMPAELDAYLNKGMEMSQEEVGIFREYKNRLIGKIEDLGDIAEKDLEKGHILAQKLIRELDRIMDVRMIYPSKLADFKSSTGKSGTEEVSVNPDEVKRNEPDNTEAKIEKPESVKGLDPNMDTREEAPIFEKTEEEVKKMIEDSKELKTLLGKEFLKLKDIEVSKDGSDRLVTKIDFLILKFKSGNGGNYVEEESVSFSKKTIFRKNKNGKIDIVSSRNLSGESKLNTMQELQTKIIVEQVTKLNEHLVEYLQ